MVKRNQNGSAYIIRDEEGRKNTVLLFQRGYKPKQIAEELGYSYSTICKWLKEKNLGNGFNKRQTPSIKVINEMGYKHIDGATYKQLAEEYGTTVQNVCFLCNYYGYQKYERLTEEERDERARIV